MDRVREGGVFCQFFQRRIWIIVIHRFHCSAGMASTALRAGLADVWPGPGRQRYIISVPHKSCRWTIPNNLLVPSTTTRDVIFVSSINARAVAANSFAPMVLGFAVIH